jgi:hypothetical protein
VYMYFLFHEMKIPWYFNWLLVLIFSISSSFLHAQAPQVSHVCPNAGMTGSTITARVYGNVFLSPAITSIELHRAGNPDILASSITVVSNKYLACTFDLTGAATGLYHLVVKKAASADSLPLCFSIYNPYPATYRWSRTVIGAGTMDAIPSIALGGVSCNVTPVSNEMVVTYIYNEGTPPAGTGFVRGFWWHGTGWLSIMYGMIPLYHCSDIAIGDRNNDGYNDIFAACEDDFVHVYQSPGWTESTIWDEPGPIWAVGAGDGNGDGEIEVYGGAWLQYFLAQYHWNGSTWDRETMACSGNIPFDIAVGDGNNDNELEVYFASSQYVQQYKWNGATWDILTLETSTNPIRGVTVGDGDNDGNMEVYGASQFGDVYQYEWNGATWDRSTVGSVSGIMYKVKVSDGDGDGLMELYCSHSNGSVYEYNWNGSSWDFSAIPLPGTMQMIDIAIGDGNNNGNVEIYTVNRDGNLYQYKLAPAPWISLSDNAHDFGQVIVGDSLDWEYLVIYNQGSDTLFIDSIISDTADYYVVNPTSPDTIVAGESMPVQVRFKPAGIGVILGELNIYSNDPYENPAIVNLTGEGVVVSVQEAGDKSLFRVMEAQNPSVKHACLNFTLPARDNVTMQIHDASGRLLDTPCSAALQAGAHTIAWTPVSSGVYFYTLHCSYGTRRGKFVILK